MKPVVKLYNTIANLLEKEGGRDKKRPLVSVALTKRVQEVSVDREKLSDAVTLTWNDEIASNLLTSVGETYQGEAHCAVGDFLSQAFHDLSQIRHDSLAIKIWWRLHKLLWVGHDGHFLCFERIGKVDGGSGAVLLHVSNLQAFINGFTNYWRVSGSKTKKK